MKYLLNILVRAAGWAFAVLAAAQVPVHAATDKAEFGIKGIGATDCATVVREYKAGSPNAMMYGGWMYGYITAMNQVTHDTFDLAPWHDLNTLTNFIVEYCQKNPRTSYGQAVFSMTAALRPKRLKMASTPTRITRDGMTFIMYGDVIKRMAEALKAKGFYRGPVALNRQEFTGELSKAVKAFQTRNKLHATGHPDQITLFRLFER